ncbi:Hermansky-Pudlak syndrome 6 protein [Protopterus annectens]|uniref:Hermansky-Pudlak syndrome 6 protein n=1 Tax=Protopterus annectens TaxID=7888 RepID=UPI001CFB12D7|nr:Hermansky-Pudlak syndrome 6 protein [Protopterus annectens]
MEFVTEQISDFTDFTRGKQLADLLQHQYGVVLKIWVSGDGKRIALCIGTKERYGELLTFDRICNSGLLQPPTYLDRSLQQPSGSVGLADLFYLQDRNGFQWAALVLQNGRVEFWKCKDGMSTWELMHTCELCNSLRGRVTSVCTNGTIIVWCEERPATSTNSVSSVCRYCICKRSLELSQYGVILGGLKIVLHDCPSYRLFFNVASEGVFMVPAASAPGTVSGLLLIWLPKEDILSVSAPSHGLIHSQKLTLGGSDFKTVVLRSIGLLSFTGIHEIHNVALSSCGGLLLMDKSGRLSIVYPTGTQTQICHLEASKALGTKVSMQALDSLLALFFDRVLYLVNLNTGKLVQKIVLTVDELIFLDCFGGGDISFLGKNGIYMVKRATGPKNYGQHYVNNAELSLEEMIFEEACSYYQRRSLSGTRLTVEKLKKEGTFQAPIMLSTVLQNYLKHKRVKGLGQEPCSKLLSIMVDELQSYSSLEELKSCVVNANESDITSFCEELVDQELGRLLRSDIDRGNLVYLNMIFCTFPREAWEAVKSNLQLQSNGAGSLSARATSDVWKTVVGQGDIASQESLVNGVFPVFELICHSLYRFRPKWLPKFVTLTQQHICGSWNYGSKDRPDRIPLYKRALSVLPKREYNSTTTLEVSEMEVELLLCSQRPKAVMQAIKILIDLKKWSRVIEVAQTCSQISPLLRKDIFTFLLTEVSQHRNLDNYSDQLWALCPEDMSAPEIINIVLKNIPSSNQPLLPFPVRNEDQLSIGLLSPLLIAAFKQRSMLCDQYAATLESPSFPPPTPPRDHCIIPRTCTEPALHVLIQQEILPRTTSLPDIKTDSAL